MIALIDCNNFFVSCERIFCPSCVNQPTVVLSNNDGCAISRSNEAKEIGIKMGQPHFEFRDLERIHKVKVFSANFSLYGAVSKRVMTKLQEFSSHVEVYSIDEAFLDIDDTDDVTKLDKIAKSIKESIMNDIGVPVSVGIAKTKVLAKLACDKEKRGKGYCVLIENEKIEEYLKSESVSEVWGIGRNYSKSLARVNINSVNDLRLLKGTENYRKYNVNIQRIIEELNGIPCINSENNFTSKKSISHTRTLFKKVSSKKKIERLTADFTASVVDKLQKQHSVCSNLSVFLAVKVPGGRYEFHSYHASFTPTSVRAKLLKYAVATVRKIYQKDLPYGRVGVTIYGISPSESNTKTLFDFHDTDKELKIDAAINRVNARYHNIVKLGNQSIIKSTYKANQNLLSKNFMGDFEELLVI